MNINPISAKQSILKNFKHIAILLPLAYSANTLQAQNLIQDRDVFVSNDSLISPKGIEISNNHSVPNPQIVIGKDTLNANIVVDLNKNILYLYDESGIPLKAYQVASGKASTPTPEGVRKIINIEKYPYKLAPESTKRHKYPNDYGPRALILNPINMDTNELTKNDGIFIHGTNKPASIGKKASKGCIRMDNEAIKEIAGYVKKGQYVVFER